MILKTLKYILPLALAMVGFSAEAENIEVSLLTDAGTERTPAVAVAERNLAEALTEINRANGLKEPVVVRDLKMDDFAKKSLARIWAVTPFYCDDDYVAEKVWVFREGNMMVSHIPLIITPEGEDFGVGNYQEAVVEFDRNGTITDFRFALDAHMSESMAHCGDVVEKEQQMIILQYMERFRTAYNKKDIETIDRMFSEDALIITGNVVTVRSNDGSAYAQKVTYDQMDKQRYIAKLRRAFARNKWIDVKFNPIDEDSAGGCGGITRSKLHPNMYGVRVQQSWKSSNYNDEGYLFLLWEFPQDGGDPIIHVRTWQPEFVNGQRQAPDNSISTLGGFDL